MKAIKWLIIVSVILFCCYLYACISSLIKDHQQVNKVSSPVGIDYAMYYSAGQIALSGNAADAYDVTTHNNVLSRVIERPAPALSWWIYPPTFFLLIAPLASLPYYVSLAVWSALTLALAIFALRSLLPKLKHLSLIALGFPGLVMNLRWGQNAFLSTALLGFGIAFWDTNPLLSGLMFGLLTFKPQIAIFPFLILLVCKKWKTLLWAVLFGVSAAVLSGILFGFDTWLIYIRSFFQSSSTMLSSSWEHLSAVQPSFYSVLRIAGINTALIYPIVLIIGIATAIAVRWVCTNTDRLALKGSALVLGLLLAVPYYIQYDLMILSIPLVLLAYDFIEQGSRPWEIIFLQLLWCLPLLSWILVLKLSIQIAPFVALIGLLLTLRRAKQGFSKAAPLKATLP